MVKHLCPDTFEQKDYSGPVPVIGLIIAAATVVCFLLMISDTIHGIRNRKSWLPCKNFSLDSVTLTLLSIVVKLPVDLTTSMPSLEDQLSKLTGTAVLCVSMGFLMPSIGVSRASEQFTNMVAMTILVLTVTVCIQMVTGVIFSFIIEHYIILYCTLMMLTLLWFSSWEINSFNSAHMNNKNSIITNDSESLLSRLRFSYIHSCTPNPQLTIGRSRFPALANILGLMCLIVVLEGTFRSLVHHELRFCSGVSDYRWSMKVIVVTHILVIILATLASSYRTSGMTNTFSLYEESFNMGGLSTISSIVWNFPFLKGELKNYLIYLSSIKMRVGFWITVIVLYLPSMAWLFIMTCIPVPRVSNLDVNMSSLDVDVQIEKRCFVEGIMWDTANKSSNALHQIRALFAKRSPSKQSLEELNGLYFFTSSNQVSCLYLIFLVRVVSVSLPSTISGPLTKSLSDVFDIIHFLDGKISLRSKEKLVLAKALWNGSDFSTILPKIEKQSPSQDHFDINHPLEVIKSLKNVFPRSFIWDV